MLVRRTSLAASAFLLLLGAWLAVSGGAAVLTRAGTRASEKPLKLLVEKDSSYARRASVLGRAGMRVVADYGSYVLAEIPRRLGATALRTQGLRVRRERPDGVRLQRRLVSAGALRARLPVARAAADLHLLRFAGPPRPEWVDALHRIPGARILMTLPEDAYLVWLDGASHEALHSLPAPVEFVAPLDPSDRLGTDLDGDDDPLEVTLLFAETPQGAAAAAAAADRALESPGVGPQLRGLLSETLTIPREVLEEISSWPELVWAERYQRPEIRDELSALLTAGVLTQDHPIAPHYREWLAFHGLDDLSAYVVHVMDTGIDTGGLGREHPALAGRLVFSTEETVEGSLEDCIGHGTHIAGIIAGDPPPGFDLRDEDGFELGLGIAPTARFGSSRIFCCTCSGSLIRSHTEIYADAYQRGARISNNSWGGRGNLGSSYTALAREIDGIVRDANADPSDGDQSMVTVFAAGNSDAPSRTIDSPGVAKNVITVGASESFRPLPPDGCGNPGTDADSPVEVRRKSARGPTVDGRLKPDLVAPGSNILSTVSQSASFTGLGVCDAYHPPGQRLYTRTSGTSQATAHVSGAAVLVMEDHERSFGAPPSPAMVKAQFIAMARDLGRQPSGTLPSIGFRPANDQGWGRADVSAIIESRFREAFDQAHLFTASGQGFVEGPFHVVDPSRPTAVVLAWTDAPGAPAGSAWVNDLDLELAADGRTYLGNVFEEGFSVLGGSPDGRNNVEAVILRPGAATSLTVRVVAVSIPGDGVPSVPGLTDQDFALYLDNVILSGAEGRIRLGEGTYACGSEAEVLVADQNLAGGGRVRVDAASTSEPSGEPVYLQEDSPGSGLFRGPVRVEPGTAAVDGVIQVADGDDLIVSYADDDRGDGFPGSVSAAARIRCAPLTISDVRTESLGPHHAVIAWTTDRPADSRVTGDPGVEAHDPVLVTEHRIAINDLPSCVSRRFRIASTDRTGISADFPLSGDLGFSTAYGERVELFFDDFESFTGGWSHSGSEAEWELGLPKAGPGAAHSGLLVWGTDLDGAYEEGADMALASGPVDLRRLSGPKLTFWHFVEIPVANAFGEPQDGAWIEVSADDGATWTVVAPEGGYPVLQGPNNPHVPPRSQIFAGSGGGWNEASVDLSPFQGQRIRLRFRLWRDPQNAAPPGAGWYIDDVRITADVPCHEGILAIAAEAYGCSSVVRVALTDTGLNLDRTRLDQGAVTATSGTDSLDVTLTETAIASAEFAGSFELSASGSPGALATAEGDQITVTYLDASAGSGAPVTVQVSADVLDCVPPDSPSEVRVDPAGPNQLRLEWNDPAAPDLAEVRVHYDEDAPGPVYSGESALEGASPFRAESGRRVAYLSGLPACTPQYVSLTAVDVYGNESGFSAEVVGVPAASGPCNRALVDLSPADAAGCTQDLLVTVRDANAVQDPNAPGMISATAASPSDPNSLTVTLTESHAGSGIFTGTLPLTGAGVTGRLHVAEGDEISVVYVDADTGSGAPAAIEATVPVVDCVPPLITNVRVGSLGFGEITLEWETDEPADTTLEYGLDANVEQSVDGPPQATHHAVTLPALPACSSIFYRIVATDRLGNSSLADDAGAPFHTGTGRDLVLFFDDLESGAPGWRHLGAQDEWEHGSPVVGPPGAFSGLSVWGLDLDDTYDAGADVRLTSPEIDLTGADIATLSFRHWYDIWSSSPPSGLDDAAWVEVSPDGGATWIYIEPIGGYTDQVPFPNDYLPQGTPVYAGNSSGWELATLPLDAFAGERIKVGFHFLHDPSPEPPWYLRPGWYIDDFEVRVAAGCHSGTIRFGAPPHDCGGPPLRVRVTDMDLDTDPGAPENVTVQAVSPADPDVLNVTLTETGPSTGAFAGSFPIGPIGAPAGMLEVSEGDLVTVSYDDADDGTGAPATVFDTALIGDCTAPAISDVRTERIAADRALVNWRTDEPATSEIVLVPGGVTFGSGSLVTDHAVEITGLTSCAAFEFRVVSADAGGNTAIDDNGGALFPLEGRREVELLSEGFEMGAPGWTLSGERNEWEFGTPAAGPPGPFQGTGVAGTDLDGDYDKDTHAQRRQFELISPPFSLEGFSGATLTFRHFHDFALSRLSDGGVVEILDEGEWVAIAPLGGYQGEILADRAGTTMPAYTGTSNEWVLARFMLDGFADRKLRLRFRAILDNGLPLTGTGWYLDQILVTGVGACRRGLLQLDHEGYSCGPTDARVLLSDTDLDADPNAVDTAQVRALAGSDAEDIALTETGPGTGLFAGTIPLAPAPAPGALVVAEGDLLTVVYDDADDGSGAPSTVATSAPVDDCSAPAITDVRVERREDGSTLRLHWVTDEPASTEATLSLPGSDPILFSSDAPVTDHEVDFTGLSGCGLFTTDVASSDARGNRTAIAGSGPPLQGEMTRRRILFVDDMEGQDPGWSSGGYLNEWERGEATVGPPLPFSGTRVWGTDLDGLYEGGTDATLISPSIDLGGLASASLTFWHYFDVIADSLPNAGDDGAWVEILIQGAGEIRYVEPVGGYNNTIDRDGHPPIPGGSGVYAGNSGAWRRAIFDFTPFVGKTVSIRFRVWNDLLEGGSPQIPGFGWYIDDVEVTAPGTCFPAPALSSVTAGDPLVQGITGVLLEISGANLRAPLRLDAGEDVALHSITVVSPQQATAVADISTSAASGSRALQAVNPDGQAVILNRAIRIEIDPRRVDMDGSGIVDGMDLAILARAFGTFDGEALYDTRADLNADGTVDGLDLAALGARFGESVTP
jgi:bacillopeptidase F (M6 metalloprotease family)